MQHRHLNHQGYTLASIDDIIARGRWKDWADLRAAALADAAVIARIERVCLHQTRDPYAQRHHFWLNYVRFRKAAA